MTHLGVYFAPEHSRQSDRDFIAALQPPVVRILDPDVQNIATVHALAPNAIIAPRIWTIDDNNGQAVRDLMADPIGTGKKHADQYRASQLDWYSQASQRGLTMPPSDRLMFNAANEPNQGGTPDKIAVYNVAFLEMCRTNGIRAAALCLGVGWPDNTGPDTPVNWKPYADAGLFDAIARGNHWLELHEYNYKAGPQDGWRWLAGRHLQCPFDVPILLGEIGIDNYVDKARWDREGGNRGWQGNVSPDVYAEMIEYHIRNSDRRVVAALPFITDYRSNAWESFDTAQAHQALLARKDRMVPQVALPSTPTAPTATMFVTAVSGLNLRASPEGDVLIAIPYAAPVTITGVPGSANNGWLRASYAGHTGWIASAYVSTTKPQSTIHLPNIVGDPPEVDEPTPSGDSWQRCIAFVRRWEGGWADDPNDPGGATNKGITIGTYTKWLQDHGQAIPTKDDLRNISDAEADQIYFEWYWKGSGADKLPWPLCLAHFDTAVNAGTGRATEMMQKSGGDFLAYMGHLISWYTRIDGFEHFGRAWIRRRAEILLEAAK